MSTFLRILSVCALALAAVSARAEIGTVQFAIGDVRLTTAQGTRAIAKGDLLNEGDTLIVGSGSAQIKMVDGGYLAVRPDTQMKFDQYKWAGKEDGSERGLLSLVRGGFRSITGALGRVNKQNFKINTPTATIGIRGTDHEILFVPAGIVSLVPMPAMLAQAGLQLDVAPLFIGEQETLVPMLLAQAGPQDGGQGGMSNFANTTIVKNNVGVSTIQQRVGGVATGVPLPVSPNQIGVVRLGQPPSILPPGVGTNLVRATPPPGSKPPAPPAPPAGAAGGQQSGQQGGAQGQQTQQQGPGQSQQTSGEGQQQAQSGQQGGQSQSQGQGQSQQTSGEGQQQAQSGQQGGQSQSQSQGQSQQTSGEGQQQAQSGQQGGQSQSQGQGAAPAQASQATATAAAPAQQQAEPIRVASVVDSPTQVAAASQTATQSVVTSPVATASVVTVAPTTISGSGGGSTSSSSTTSSTTATTTPVVLTSSSGLTVNTTSNTVVSSSGIVVPVSQGAFASLADTAANLATTGATSLSALSSGAPALNGLQLPNEISAATALATAAQSAATGANALTIDTATPTATAGAALTATNAANAVFTANGAFADATLAIPAKNVMTTANSTAAAISFTTQSSSLSSIKTSITSVQNNVNIGLSTANNALTTLTPLAAAAGVPTTTTAKDFMAVAQNAAALASSAAAQALSFQNAGNITSAQAQLTIAQQQQAIAESALAAATSILAGVGATQAVNALAGLSTDTAATLYGLANSAQEVASLATAKATTVTTQAAIVNANAPVAQYSNPAVAAPPDGFGFLVLGTKSSGTGQEGLLVANNTSQAGNNFVLDGTKNLVHVRTAEHISAEGFNYIDTATDTSASSLSRYVKFAGGTANDGFVAADKSIYLGRWQGGTMSTYSDTGLAGGNTLLESIALGASSASWMVYVKPTSNLVPRLVGTSNYTLVAATKPTDSFGNVGTLNSASISANFSAQTVSANLNLSFTGVRTLALTAQTPDVPIYANGFLSGPGADFVPTVNCVGAGCTVGSVSSWGAVIAGGFAVANASGAGLAYRFVPNLGIAPANTPYSDQIQGVAALSATAPTVGTNPVAVGATGNFRAQLLYPLTSGGATFLGGINGLTYANTALTRDSLGNLVRVTGAPWNVFSVADSAQCTGLVTQCLNTSASNANTTAYVSMGGGTVGSLGIGFNANGDKVGAATLTETYNDTANGISFGRYQGGMVNASTVTGTFSDVLTNLGSNSVVWSTREVPASIPVSGVFHYVPTFATAPVDSLGNVGTLNRARLDVNFATQKVNPEVSVSMSSNMSLRAWAQDVPLSANFGFDVSSGASNASNSPASLLPLTVSCVGSGCAPPPVGSGEKYGYGGRINGGLAGDATANGAFFRYAFNTFYSVDAAVGTTGGIPSGTQAATTIANNYINGMVGFNRGPAAEPANGAVYSTAFFVWPYNATSTPVNLSSPLGGNDTFQTNTLLQGSGTVEANGNLLSVTEYSPGNANPQFLTLNGAPTPVSLMPTTTANGISFGRYNGQTVAQGQAGTGSALTLDGSLYTLGTFGASSSSPTTLAKSVVGALQWIRGPELWPFYVSSILQGTATYSMLAASPATDQNGFSSGTALGGGTATFGINFDKQQVNLTLSNIVVPANAGSQVRTWNATTGTNGIALGGDGSFSAYTSSPGASTYFDRTLNVTMTTTTCTPVSCAVDSSPQAAYGSVSGSLTGSGGSGTSASGAMLAYAFVANDVNNSYSREQVNGVAAFGTPTFSNASYPNTSALATQPYQIRIRTAGTISGTDANTGALRSTLGDLAFNVNNKYLTTVFGEVIDPGSIKYNDSAQPVAWDGAGIVVSGSTCGSPSSNCHTADIPTYTSVSGSAITTAAGFNVPAVASPASIADFGRDPTTGASWGRYTGGNMVSIDRITGLQLNGGEHSAGNTRHFLYSGIQSGPTVLPISGTVTYTFVGGTNPTDNATSGNFVGTLNSATLAANFTAKTVDIGVNAAVNGNNWVASATGVAIQKGLYFEASRSQGSGPLNLTCTGTCAGSTLSGQVAGAFVGTTGQGAGIAYSFNASTLSGSSISTLGQTIAGVAVFKR